MFLRQPTIVVVRAELYAVQRTMENMRMKPKTQERKKHNKNQVSDQPSNSGASLITKFLIRNFHNHQICRRHPP